MKLPVAGRPRGRDLDMLPVINLVFLLLVFVILTGGASSADKTQTGMRHLVIAGDGQLVLDGEALNAAALREKLRPPPAQLHIEAAGALPAKTLVILLEDLQQAGVVHAELSRQP